MVPQAPTDVENLYSLHDVSKCVVIIVIVVPGSSSRWSLSLFNEMEVQVCLLTGRDWN